MGAQSNLWRRCGRRAAFLTGLLALLAALVPGLAKATPYPVPPPDFTQPDARHGPLMTPASGANGRPVLVLYVSFTDAPAPAGKDAAFFSKLFFGPGFGSVADFYRAQSFGKFLLTPAAESQGTANDGVVQLTIGKQADFDASTNAFNRGRQALTLADSYVNFAAFDRNGDGRVTSNELLIYMLEVRPEFCGSTFPVGASLTLDGVDLGAGRWSGSTVNSNAATAVHELSHQAFGAFDPASYWPGRFDVHGATCIPPGAGGALDQSFWGFNAWEKLHLGWIRPTVVTRDGYYAVRRADTTGQAYVLYDPDKGTDHYLLVENRERTPGTYDKDVGDSGLVIHRFDESVYGDSTPWVQMLSPITTPAAWDPSDTATPTAKITPAWHDGSPSRVAVRAIGAHGDVISAYFDVRGPGVLADSSRLPLFKVAGGAARGLTIPVTNTGDSGSDTFTVTIEVLPAGWTSSTATITLAAQATGNATVTLTPAVGAHPGGLRLALTARSKSDPTVTSTSLFWAFVRGDGSDRDADGKADPVVFRPSTGDWWALRSATGMERRPAWGLPTDTPVPGDYDGDGHMDTAVYRAPGQWWIVDSGNGTSRELTWGGSGDVPVPGDYDGDGKTDLAVFRHATGEWLIRYSSTGASRTIAFGRLGDFPVPADYDGDGKDDVAVWRSVPGEWWTLSSATGAARMTPWGQSGDQPAPGDYDGDGRADLATFRPSTGNWSIRRSSTGLQSTTHFGQAADIPVPADYDGNGTTDIAIFRTTALRCEWWISVTPSSTRTVDWGEPGDQPATK